MATDEVTIRRAVASDTDVLVKFARALALETEGRELPAERVQRGVREVHPIARPCSGSVTLVAGVRCV